MLRSVVFDFGGVLAEEGFREGLREIARKNGLDPDDFSFTADLLIYTTGYLTGHATEEDFWKAVRERTGVRGTDKDLRGEILKRFLLRPPVVSCVDLLRAKGFSLAMLSDQTNWLEELDPSGSLSGRFDRVLNSMRTGRSKRTASTFGYLCETLELEPREMLFIDDNKGHIERATNMGLNTILYTTYEDFRKKVQLMTGVLCGPGDPAAPPGTG